MVVERVNYYDEELGHRWTSVDFRLVLKLLRCIWDGSCLCRKGAELTCLKEGFYYTTRADRNYSILSGAAGVPLVPIRYGYWVDDYYGKVRKAIGVDAALVISKGDDTETVNRKVSEVLRAWKRPDWPPYRICPHLEEI